MSLVAERPYKKQGSAILIREDLKVKNVYERVQGTFELITIVMSAVVVHSAYKPPNNQFALPKLGHRNLPHIVIGYFKSHSTPWGYDTTDNNGEAVEQWDDSCDFTLIHDNKLPQSFNSAKCKKGYNPDFNLHLKASRTCVRCQSWTLSRTTNTDRYVLVPTQSGYCKIYLLGRFNFMNADRNGYSAELDRLIEDVEPIPANYKCFIESVHVSSRRPIPRGCRTDYVPGLTDESNILYESHKHKYSRSPFDDGTV